MPDQRNNEQERERERRPLRGSEDTKPFTILGIAGSLRRHSFNMGAVRAAEKLLPPGVRLEIFELKGIPPFNQDDEKTPPEIVRRLKEKIRASDAVLFATPEYNYSVPGVLKNAIDWASRPYGDNAWDGKPAAIMGAAGGRIGTARAQYDLRKMMVFLNMHPLNRPEVLISEAGKKFDEEGNLVDAPTRDIIQQLVQALVTWARELKKVQVD